MSELPDSVSLEKRIREGGRAAETDLVRAFGHRVFSMVRIRTGDSEHARDLTHDILMDVLSALRNGQIRRPDRLPAFVYAIARNHCSRHIRAERRRASETPLDPNIESTTSADHLETVERKKLFLQALKQLDAADQKILLLALVDGLKPGEIALQLGMNPARLRKRKSRALRKVMEFVKQRSQK